MIDRETLVGQHRSDTSAVIDWADLLVGEERRCRHQGFRAGVVSINLSFDDGVIDARDHDELRERVEIILQATLRWTDRYCVLAPDEFGALLIPLRSYGELRRLAQLLHRRLRTAGIHCRIGYAARNDHTGLAGAAARADAAAATPLRPSA